jgi:hypothetical protein
MAAGGCPRSPAQETSSIARASSIRTCLMAGISTFTSM